MEYGSQTDPYSTPGLLPEQLKSELYFPCAICARDLAKSWACYSTARISKVRVVEEIKEFRPKLQLQAFGYAEILHEREVNTLKRRPNQGIGR